jgi:hypothetical protein
MFQVDVEDRTAWSTAVSPLLASTKVDGYLDGLHPEYKVELPTVADALRKRTLLHRIEDPLIVGRGYPHADANGRDIWLSERKLHFDERQQRFDFAGDGREYVVRVVVRV